MDSSACSFITMTPEPTSQNDQNKTNEQDEKIVESLTLRFDGENEDGSRLHELRAAHVAEVLQGLVGITGDFDKAGAFDVDGRADSEILVRPAKEGSFLIEVVRIAHEYGDAIAAGAVPTIGMIIAYATKSARAEVKEFERNAELDLVKITWQDDTVNEVSTAVWEELNKREPRRKKQLRELMAPLSDKRVHSLDIELAPEKENAQEPEVLTLTIADYDAVKPVEDIEENTKNIDVEAQMSAIDFDDSKKWKIKTKDETRGAVMDDAEFLKKVSGGLAIRKDDIFELSIRVDEIIKNGKTRTTWTVLEVKSHRRAAGDDNS